MKNESQQRFESLIEELGLATKQTIRSIQPLTGGVASDIVLVELENQRVCIKCARAKLKVAEDWLAPVHRNQAEYAWLKVAATVNSKSAVKLLGRSELQQCFAMEFIEGENTYLWKTSLLNGQVSELEAILVGRNMGRIHAFSSQTEFNRLPFENQQDFYALRLDPYLNFTAQQNPGLSEPLSKLVELIHHNDSVLVHGDISPKNILFRRGEPIFLDAECATMGDPGFDVAFCMNHLLLKAVHVASIRNQLLAAVLALWQSYAQHINWEPINDLEQRVCLLLPALMLARVDGKSPVEYLSHNGQLLAKHIAIELIQHPILSLSPLVNFIETKLGDTTK